MTWYVLEKLMQKETTEKIKFIQKNKFTEILEKISEEQLENKFGGIIEDQNEYWYLYSI